MVWEATNDVVYATAPALRFYSAVIWRVRSYWTEPYIPTLAGLALERTAARTVQIILNGRGDISR